MTTSTNRVRTNVYLDSDMKAKAKEIFKMYGLGLSEAFNMFLSQSVLERGIPFQVKIPNETTRKAIEETRAGINTEEISFEDFKKELDEIRSAKA